MAEIAIAPIKALTEDAGVEDILEFYETLHTNVGKVAAKYMEDMHKAADNFLNGYFSGLVSTINNQGGELVILRTIELILRRGIGTPENINQLLNTLSSYRKGLSTAATPLNPEQQGS